jgi:hypothetical protein
MNKVLDQYRVPSGKSSVDLDEWDTNDGGRFTGEDGKAKASNQLADDLEAIDRLQETLYASRGGSLLVVLQVRDLHFQTQLS